MKRLSEDFRRMLEGLAHQDAAEYLPMRDKYRVLGIGQPRDTATVKPVVQRRRVALVSDGRTGGGHIGYAVDAARRQRAGLDIVLHGGATSDSTRALDLLGQVRRHGIETQLVELKGNDVQALREYVAQRPSLLLMVARAGDVLSRTFTESALLRSQRLYVPMVMIEDNPPAPLAAMSYA
ncbi:MAG: hypothetical protein J5I92_01670 [Thiogranum sp.]|nr:hypothetical protein [Thiogranum sp.]